MLQDYLKQDWEIDPEISSFKRTDITEKDLDVEEIEEEEQRKKLILSIKNRKKNPLNPSLFENDILKSFIESELLEEEEFQLPKEEIFLKAIGTEKIAKEFEFFKNREIGMVEEGDLKFELKNLKIKEELLKKATNEILNFEKRKEEKELIESNNFMTLTLSLEHPIENTLDYIQIPLKNSLYSSTTNSMDIFIIVKDENEEEYKNFLEENHKLGEFEVVSISQFFKFYSNYIQKIRLVNSYDFFFS